MTPDVSAEQPTQTVSERITAYLASGGLWNPELANHDAVRDLLIDARDELAACEARAIERCECYLRETRQGSICGLHKQQKEALAAAQRKEKE